MSIILMAIMGFSNPVVHLPQGNTNPPHHRTELPPRQYAIKPDEVERPTRVRRKQRSKRKRRKRKH
jgi:hypothetical protein